MEQSSQPFGLRLSDGLGLAVDAGTVCADPMREAMRRFTTLPRKGTPAAGLTECEKLALCIAAGAPTETTMEGGFLTVRTTVPCGVADRGDGGYIVAVGARPNVELSGPPSAGRLERRVWLLEMTMENAEWLRRCAAQYESLAGLTPAEAQDLAQIALEEDADADFADDPEGAADSDMSYWTDDGA